ncbi:MAG: hypothetical protein WBF53_17055 [Litorimonas sp.]
MRTLLIAAAAAFALSGCMTVAKTTGKAAALPFKATYHTGKMAGKGVLGTAKLAGRSAVATGKGVYYVGTVPVKITDSALDTSAKVLTVTTQAVDLTGKVVTTSRDINAARLDLELDNIRRAKNIVSVVIDA